MLTIDRVSKQFGSFLAVNDISFDVRPAEILALVGGERLRQDDGGSDHRGP